MSQNTEKINEAIQEFLESEGINDLEAVKIMFKEKQAEPMALAEENCEWVWDPVEMELVWVCYP